MIEEFGFINAKYLKDWFHLFDTGLKDLFGKETSKLLRISPDDQSTFQRLL